mmetsp:Transcript_108653/g.335600  ORF Transcript_108653/g.335600 Transcript_108653/m.335600 type:complete len:413 (-) Transcript_108653:46-1284(-)
MAKEMKSVVACILVVICWLLLGTVIYKVADNCSVSRTCTFNGVLLETDVCGWTWGESFYYAVQAGLSIGFGLLAETNDGSRFYTICHILIGSTIVTGCLSFLVTLLVSRHSEHKDKEETRLAKYCQRIHKDGFSGLKLEELRGLMIRHPRFYRDVMDMVEDDPRKVETQSKAFRHMQRTDRTKAADDLIEEANVVLKGKTLNIDDFEEVRAKERGHFRQAQIFYQQNAALIITMTALAFFIILGIIFGLVVEKFSFITSLYFAVSSLSTAGLQTVTRSTWQVLFTGLWALIGVPVYAAAVGSFANVLVGQYNTQAFDQKMEEKFSVAEVEFVEHINGIEGSDTLSRTEFLEVQVLKLGLADRDLLRSLRDQFNELDTSRSGTVNKADVLKGQRRKIDRINARITAGRGPERL